jgi:hypothetical protein
MVISLGIGVPNLGKSLFKVTKTAYPDAVVKGIGPICSEWWNSYKVLELLLFYKQLNINKKKTTFV